MCICKCGGKRDCCGPQIPTTQKAKTMRTALFVIGGCHIIVLFIKCYLMGIFAGLSDLVGLILLLLAIIRYDYCLTISYIVLNLFEVFSLIVVLGYYLQTDMGKNVPQSKSPEKHEHEDKEQQEHSIMRSHQAKGKANRGDIHFMLRGLFDKILSMKYSFYQTSVPAAKEAVQVASEVLEDAAIQLKQEGGEEDSPSNGKLAQRHGPVFIICFCSGLILFYIVASMVAHCAYREWKGLAEDCAGGSINRTDGNFLHYAVIDKREEAAIEEREAEEKAKKEREAANSKEDDMQPLMQNQENNA